VRIGREDVFTLNLFNRSKEQRGRDGEVPDDVEVALFCQDREFNQAVSRDLLRNLVNSVPCPLSLMESRDPL